MPELPAMAGIELANWNWKVVHQFVLERFGIVLSRSGCLNYLHRLGFAFKRPKKRLLKADGAKREAFVAEYAALTEEARRSGAKIFFADEAHFRADAELRGKWVLKGKPALVDSTSPRYGEKASYYSAVCSETGEVEWMSSKRSPYFLSLPEFVHRFGQSVERRSLINGLLRYRALLQQAGVGAGFQWINGSFVEDVERIRGRPPADIDVVSFISLPTGVSELDFYGSHGEIFDRDYIKSYFPIDGYIVAMDPTRPETVLLAIRNAVYWYSVWSHTREHRWKGYIELDLDSEGDPGAWQLIQEMTAEGGG